jgi:hypothetical protein
MPSTYEHSEKVDLQLKLNSESAKFDYALEQEEDCESAKIIFQKIKELRTRLKELNVSTSD